MFKVIWKISKKTSKIQNKIHMKMISNRLKHIFHWLRFKALEKTTYCIQILA